MTRVRLPILSLAFTLAAPRAFAQPAKNPLGLPIEPPPAYVRTTPPADAVIQRIWTEGMTHSQAASLAQVLMDSIGPRLTGSPGMARGQDWLLQAYASWGIAAHKERYGTWNAWQRGTAFVQLTAPRTKPIEAHMLSWSGHTNGAWIDGEVVPITPYRTVAEYRAWLGTVAGKIVLASAPHLTCRSPQQVAEFATATSAASLDSAQRALNATYAGLTQRAPSFYDDVKAAGAVAVFEHDWSNYPGIDRVFGSPRNAALPTLDIGCEDYGLLFRLAERRQGPRVRLMATSEPLGEQPVFNVVAQIPGATRPREYVVLSAHFDSWEGHSGATDNGTGSIVMLEAMRILKAVLPTPSRTIVAGHWSGEEQGLNGSGAFAADHPEVVKGVQFVFNQDNGTGRIVSTGPGIHPENGPRLAQYMSQMPAELTQTIRLNGPSGIGGGSDDASFRCWGAPAVALNALSWDYSYTTWHTNRDAFDKIMQDDLKQNATLVAMFAYLASEDPQPSSKVVVSPLNGPGGRPITLPACPTPQRSSTGYRR